MSSATELLKGGQLLEAVKQATQEVKAKPTDVSARTLLFELLCFSGELDRAEKQLEVLGQQSPAAELGVQVYRNNLQAERDRRKLFGLKHRFR